MFDWGDGNQSEWLGPFDQRETVNISHIWSLEGVYNITVKAKDSYGNESGWSEPLTVNIMILSLTKLRGGLGVHATITNIGKRKIWFINWNITVVGGLIQNPANGYYNGSIVGLPAGEIVNIASGAFFEIGKVKITIALQDREGVNALTKTVNGFTFGYILILLPW